MTEKEISFSYKFSKEEVLALALLIRKNSAKIPKELFGFARTVQDKMYSTLSIDEVEKFYKNENA